MGNEREDEVCLMVKTILASEDQKGNYHRKQLNQLMTFLDGFDSGTGHSLIHCFPMEWVKMVMPGHFSPIVSKVDLDSWLVALELVVLIGSVSSEQEPVIGF